MGIRPVASPFDACAGGGFSPSDGGRAGRRGDEPGEAGAGPAAEFVGGHEAFLVGFVAEAGADGGQGVVQAFVLGAAVEAQDEGVAEAALVRGMRRPQRGALGGARGRGRGGRLVGQRARDGAGGEVVAGLVGGGEQRAEVGVRAVGGEAAGPVPVVEAAEEGALGVGGGRRVEGRQPRGVGRGACGAGRSGGGCGQDGSLGRAGCVGAYRGQLRSNSDASR